MTKTLVFHTLVSRAWDFRLSHSDPEQPPLLGLVGALLDETGELGRVSSLITLPEGSLTSQAAYELNGITDDMVANAGRPQAEVLEEFKGLMEKADYLAAYSIDHHFAVLRRSAGQCDIQLPTVALYCLMRKSTNICKLPSRMNNVYKMPKLAEAYEKFAHKELSFPDTQDPAKILDWHLKIRILIHRGINLAEARELSQAARPLTKPRPLRVANS